MKILTYDNKEDWFAGRLKKITGSKAKDIIVLRGSAIKIGYYELIADHLAIPESGDEAPRDRGVRLEPDAIARFEKETGKKVDTSLTIWVRDDNENIAVSPDGAIGKTEAVEAKCLSSARHLEAWLTQQVPKENVIQTIQYFIVNEDLETLHVVFYDPRIPAKNYFVIEVKREDVKEEIEQYLEFQIKTLEEVEKVVLELSKF